MDTKKLIEDLLGKIEFPSRPGYRTPKFRYMEGEARQDEYELKLVEESPKPRILFLKSFVLRASDKETKEQVLDGLRLNFIQEVMKYGISNVQKISDEIEESRKKKPTLVEELELAVINKDTGKFLQLIEGAKDKKFVLDIAALPMSVMNVDEWVFFFKELNLILIDSREAK